YGNFSQYPWVDIYPTFGDLNNDGIADIILGYEDDKTNGFIHYFEGTGNGNYTFKYPQYLDVDVGNSARPKLVDIDEDGLLDLIIGNKKGNLHFFKNEGTKEEANFQLVSKKWGDIDLSNIDVQGAWLSSDILDHSKYGKLLLLGTITGVTYAYKNISTNPESVFELFSYNFFGSNEGEKATISVGDINNDKYPDIVIGNMSGGLRLALDSSEIIAHENKLVVYPNPIEENNYLFLKYKTNLSKLKLEAFDISGRRVNIIILDDRIDISKLNNGIYILREYLKGEYISAKFIISR
ncbi:MAG: T9SS type A sorting domain-containing protein, partial [Flavobacteriales bacterium]|nr:T9SS type A sorting domain-containing protein [Flavobacteriales bacterium]